MKTLRLVLGDQLCHELSSLTDLDLQNDVVLMVEVHDETTYVPHHKQKLVMILSAMRHFANELRDRSVHVDYVELTEPDNTGSFTGELKRALNRHSATRIVVTEPGEWRVLEMMRTWEHALQLPVEIRRDDRFLCSKESFAAWAEGRKGLRMEYFYREMRRKTGWLMDGKKPVGGAWNYDSENRKPWPKGKVAPSRSRTKPDSVTQSVIHLVEGRFPNHFGRLDQFDWPVTRSDALQTLDHFIDDCLPFFGEFQDAMSSQSSFLYHSLLSPALNIGLLTARDVCEAALQRHQSDPVPLSALEGFIRQILGWREYIRGIYWLKMPGYESSNYLDANRPLPDFYWTAETDMACLRHAIESTRDHAYAHHIQRLMITGNFALLAGIAPAEVERWYLLVYADAFEWVELPNTHGMALFADGGLLATKPYAASGSYINRMSDYCSTCRYNPNAKLGDSACPFNYLYWDFLIRNRAKLQSNPRMSMPYRTLGKMAPERLQEIQADAKQFLDSL